MNTLGIVLRVLFALLMGLAYVFSRRGPENAWSVFLLLTSFTVAAPIFMHLTLLTTDVWSASSISLCSSS